MKTSDRIKEILGSEQAALIAKARELVDHEKRLPELGLPEDMPDNWYLSSVYLWGKIPYISFYYHESEDDKEFKEGLKVLAAYNRCHFKRKFSSGSVSWEAGENTKKRMDITVYVGRIGAGCQIVYEDKWVEQRVAKLVCTGRGEESNGQAGA